VTAVFRYLAPRATVVGIDHIQALTEWSKQNLRKDGVEGVSILCGDGRLGRSSQFR
jgi:protein-L-isoaspartate(D-aspartate) O-methyltransferase